MRIKCIGSGSDGNCYALISDSGEILLLDLGLPKREIMQWIDFRISDVVGAIVTHGHSDHAYAVDDFRSMGIPVFTPYEGDRNAERRQFGSFQITAVQLTDAQGNYTHSNGDGSPCPIYGFLIYNSEFGKLLYITDSYMIKYRFNNLNHILIGCNYDGEMLQDGENEAKLNHVYSGHLSQQACCNFVKTCQENSNALYNVIACHLSGSAIDGDKLMGELKKVAHSDVYVARKGTNIKLERDGYSCPF